MRRESNRAKKANLDDVLAEVLALRAEVAASEQRVRQQVADSEERVKRHVDVRNEELVHDFQGIFKDRLEQHEDRIARLEGALEPAP